MSAVIIWTTVILFFQVEPVETAVYNDTIDYEITNQGRPPGKDQRT